MLTTAVRDKRNIVVVGGTSSGKTTLANALLAEIARLGSASSSSRTRASCSVRPGCRAASHQARLASLADLVRSTLRLRPDRIIVGEVRGPEALDMLKAWNTGHPGGITTVHANSAEAALYAWSNWFRKRSSQCRAISSRRPSTCIVFMRPRRARRVEDVARGRWPRCTMASTVLRPLEPAGAAGR